jgi:hypothetical protein
MANLIDDDVLVQLSDKLVEYKRQYRLEVLS